MIYFHEPFEDDLVRTHLFPRDPIQMPEATYRGFIYVKYLIFNGVVDDLTSVLGANDRLEAGKQAGPASGISGRLKPSLILRSEKS